MKQRIITIIIASFITLALFSENRATIVSYVPAPGQFTNELPKSTAEDDSISMAAKVQQTIDRGSVVSLGGYGGYVIAKLETSLSNSVGEYDFAIYGNSFGTSAEPGVVMVSSDSNGNGQPDDTWYELAGSEYSKSIKNYTITYHKPTAESEAQTGKNDQYIKWTDNQGGEGWIPKNSFHKQSYYPSWISGNTLQFTGTLVPDNAFDKKGDGTVIELRPYEYGYVDNKPNTDKEGCSFKLDWAKDANGNDIQISSIDFIKVYTGINKVNNRIGEVSTEIGGIEILHETTINATTTPEVLKYYIDQREQTIHFGSLVKRAAIYNMSGQLIKRIENCETLSFSELSRGAYIIRCDEKSIKFIK